MKSIIRVYLESAYFPETKNFLLKLLWAWKPSKTILELGDMVWAQDPVVVFLAET